MLAQEKKATERTLIYQINVPHTSSKTHFLSRNSLKFKNVNFVKNEISEMRILWKMRFQSGEFFKNWDFQYVNFWIKYGILPQRVPVQKLYFKKKKPWPRFCEYYWAVKNILIHCLDSWPSVWSKTRHPINESRYFTLLKDIHRTLVKVLSQN